MDFWSRLIGVAYAPRKAAPKPNLNDPRVRLQRFQKAYGTVLDLCNRPRNLTTEKPLLEQLHAHIERVAALLREESRAPVPHSCLQYAGNNQIYTVIARAASVSQHEAIIRSSVAVYAALIDSEEEGFLSSAPFAKSLMRLVTRVVDAGNVVIGVDTETSILELLFTISAKIRLQPDILPVWFQTKAKPDAEDVYSSTGKKSFVGITAKEDFPLCYLLIDRVHHEGRIGDFSRTGLLYIFEATGRSLDLEEWVVSSDLPTLMATGLGALYSQLSRELSILHPDASLPAVLAMSDYSTTHPRATAESAFSDRHRAHMMTFLSYLAFWQDILDHCRSGEVKQTLLDHFQVLFLQQLLYPSLLQSSDTDAGSSVAVLSYLTAMLESLQYPDLIHNILTYLLAIRDQENLAPSDPTTPVKPTRSPHNLKRRESLLLLNAPKDPDSVVDPDLFNLVDLIINNIHSKNSQATFAALKLTSTLISRQTKYAFGTLLKVQNSRTSQPSKTAGALNIELEKYAGIAHSLHQQLDLEAAYQSLCEDVRIVIETQVPLTPTASDEQDVSIEGRGSYVLSNDDPLLRTFEALMRTFFTNSIDANLALTEAIISLALCVDVRLDNWASMPTQSLEYRETPQASRPWQTHLDENESRAWFALQMALQPPTWPSETTSMLYDVLGALTTELDTVRSSVTNLEQLIAGRKIMLQAYVPEGPLSEPPSLMSSPTQTTFLNLPAAMSKASSELSVTSEVRGQPTSDDKATNTNAAPQSSGPSPALSPSEREAIPMSANNNIYKPPPPEAPSTTDVLMQLITFPNVSGSTGEDAATMEDAEHGTSGSRTATLNHVLTNIVVLQEFVLELVAVMQVRAAVLGEKEIRLV